MANGADKTPMWPSGLLTRVCRNCTPPAITELPTCNTCGGETQPIMVYNTPKAEGRVRWGLTQREAEVMHQVASGCTNAAAAARLGITEKTVKELLWRARQKMGASNRMEAAHMWWESHT